MKTFTIAQGATKEANLLNQDGQHDQYLNTLFVDMYLTPKNTIAFGLPAKSAAYLSLDEVKRLSLHHAPGYDATEVDELIDTAHERDFDTVILTRVFDAKGTGHKHFLSRVKGLLDTKERIDEFYKQVPALCICSALTGKAKQQFAKQVLKF